MSEKLAWLANYNLLIFDSIDSTNQEARRLIKSGVDSNFVIWAKSQEQGRGRLNKKWSSDEGGLYMSILYKAFFDIENATQIPFIIGLAVYDSLKAIFRYNKMSPDIRLKWPNDVIIDDAKIAGILIETEISNTYQLPYFIILGIGVNISNDPDISEQITTSLKKLGIDIEPDILLDRILNSFTRYLRIWQEEGFLKIRDLWLKRAYKINHVVTIKSGQTRISGIFKDIDFTGAIRLMLAGGQISSLPMGEIIFDEVPAFKF